LNESCHSHSATVGPKGLKTAATFFRVVAPARFAGPSIPDLFPTIPDEIAVEKPIYVALARCIEIGFPFPKRKKIVKQTFQILASLASGIRFSLDLSSCSQKSNTDATAAGAAPLTEVDVMLNDQEKVANEYVRVAKKLRAGDVSITVRYIDLGNRTREGSAKLQQESAKLTPQQAQRLASISARTAPYVQQ
jgi:hypothetical protein